jgi:hypothetical protein
MQVLASQLAELNGNHDVPHEVAELGGSMENQVSSLQLI